MRFLFLLTAPVSSHILRRMNAGEAHGRTPLLPSLTLFSAPTMPDTPSINAMCARCQNTCKQPSYVKLVSCPLFEPKLRDDEFERLLEEMDDVSRQAEELHARVSKLIDDMRKDSQ